MSSARGMGKTLRHAVYAENGLPPISKTRCSCISTCAASSRCRPASRPAMPVPQHAAASVIPTLLRERSYTAWGWSWLESLAQDILYGLRAMLRSPGITLVALLSLALGIGANTAIFSLMDAVMLRSLPVKNPQQLVLFGKAESNGITDEFGATDLYSYPFYRELQKRNQVFSQTAAIFSMSSDVHGTVSGRNQAEPMHVQLVSGTYFPLLGVQAAIGRTLTDQDDSTKGDHPVAVVSDSWWKKGLARDPNVLNRTLKIGDDNLQHHRRGSS